MNRPKVSFVIASYNHERFIERLLQSILKQTFTDFEVIVVDDGSTDKTAQVASSVAMMDSRIRVYRQENSGVVAARNRGIQQSQGELVSVVDSDDLLPARRTEWQVEALESHALAPLVYGDAWIIDAYDAPLDRFFSVYPPVSGNFSEELFANYCFVPANSVMFRRTAFDQAGPLWGPGPNTDYLKWIELGLSGEPVCLADKQLGCWRLHGANTSTPPAMERVRQYENLRCALQELASRQPGLASRIGEKRLYQRYARCHFMGGFYAMLACSWNCARDAFANAYALHPSLLIAGAWLSTFPLLHTISRGCYRLVGRRVRFGMQS